MMVFVIGLCFILTYISVCDFHHSVFLYGQPRLLTLLFILQK